MMKAGERVLAKEIEGGIYYDTGNVLGYLKAVIDAALKHKNINSEFRKFLKSKI